MMQKITGESPNMWGDSIIGFGSLHYKYASGREGVWFKCGFSPKKSKISLYLMGCDISKAQNLLNYNPEVSLHDGILKVMNSGDIAETWYEPIKVDY